MIRQHAPTSQRTRTLVVALACSLLLLALTLLDERLYHLLMIDPDRSLERKDWWQMFRQFGSTPFWLIVGGLLIVHDRARAARHRPGDAIARAGAWHRGLMVALAAGLSGLAAEVMKGITQRARPEPDGLYRFGWTMDLDSGLGLASSHTSTAFGGAIMLAWFFPALRWPLLLIACVTAWQRTATGAHFVTDVYVGILLSYGVCWSLWKLFSTRPGGENWRPR